jgi:hypothetical protein
VPKLSNDEDVTTDVADNLSVAIDTVMQHPVLVHTYLGVDITSDRHGTLNKAIVAKLRFILCCNNLGTQYYLQRWTISRRMWYAGEMSHN